MTSTTLVISNELRTSIINNHRLIIVIPTESSVLQLRKIYNEVQNSSRPSILWLHKSTLNNDIIKELKNETDMCLYSETDKILGNTYDMLILQDYSALTPNILARSFEVVKGGGLIILIADDIKNCRMDVSISTNRFNERLYKSLLKNDSVIIINDKYEITKRSKVKIIDCKTKKVICEYESKKGKRTELDLKQKIELERKAKLYALAKTNDQREVIIELENAIVLRSCKTVCSVTAARGRGKSAALGLVVALAIHNGMSSIYILAPNVENVQTLFEFIQTGLENLEYKEKINFDLHKTVIKRKRYTSRIIVRKRQKQVIEFISPNNSMDMLPDLLIIDEAAAIPVPIVKNALKANLTFMATTINGYEGTGRSLSTKLFGEMRAMSQSKTPFLFKEFTLTEPIRYGINDPVEAWLNGTLLLNAKIPKIECIPPPEECTLYHVNRDMLFAYKKPSEVFLQDLVALFVASHYKNTPDDLMYMCDMENHCLFTLCSPINTESQEMPKILVAIQCAYESTENSKMRGGNLIPWKLHESYQLDEILNMVGLRIVRIATHPDLFSMGYGSYAINKLINAYYNKSNGSTHQNSLLASCDQLILPQLDYIGTSFGATSELIRFWKKNDFVPVHLCKTPSKTTGEHSIIVLHLKTNALNNLHLHYQNKLFRLFTHPFKKLQITLCLTLFYNKGMIPYIRIEKISDFDEFDIKRVNSFCQNKCDLQNIYDLLHIFAKLFFLGRVDVELGILEQCCLIGHVQGKSVMEIACELEVSQTNVYTVFTQIVNTMFKKLQEINQ